MIESWNVKVKNYIFIHKHVQFQLKSSDELRWMMRLDELDRSGCKHHAASATSAAAAAAAAACLLGVVQ